MNIPNIVTLLRILLIPVMVIVFYLPFEANHIVAAIIFGLAAFTDWLDGYLARVLSQTSKLGAFLDPVADKLLVAVALVIMVSENHLPYLAIPAAVIVGREIAISALREWMAEVGRRTHVAVSFLGKIKTAAQMTAVILLLAYKPSSTLWLAVGVTGYLLLCIAAVLTIVSMIFYLKAAWYDLTSSEKQP